MSGAFSSCRWTTRNPQETTNSKVLGFTTIACDGRWQNFAGYRFTYIYTVYIHTHTIWFRLDQSVKKENTNQWLFVPLLIKELLVRSLHIRLIAGKSI
jgi:hypothetical protein